MKLTEKIKSITNVNEEKKDIDIRREYYDFSDHLLNLHDAVVKSKDKEMVKLSKGLLSLKDKLVKHLDKNYRWD